LFPGHLRGNAFSGTFENDKENVATSQEVIPSSFVKKKRMEMISLLSFLPLQH
jgi:hypothetical protein